MFFRLKQVMHLADHAHPGQDHDVHGRVRVEPEHVLEQDRVAVRAPGRRCRRPQTRSTASSTSVTASTGVAEQLDQARRVHRPDEQRQPAPGHAGAAHLVDRHHDVQPGHDRAEPGDEHAEHAGQRRSCATYCELYGG